MTFANSECRRTSERNLVSREWPPKRGAASKEEGNGGFHVDHSQAKHGGDRRAVSSVANGAGSDLPLPAALRSDSRRLLSRRAQQLPNHGLPAAIYSPLYRASSRALLRLTDRDFHSVPTD